MSGQCDVVLDALADFLDDLGEREHSLELHAIPVLSEARVIAVLLSAAPIPRRHLQVAVLVRADPNVGPRGRNHQQPKPFDRRALADHQTGGIYVLEPTAMPMPADPRHCIGDVAKARRVRGADVLLRERWFQPFLREPARPFIGPPAWQEYGVAIWTPEKLSRNVRLA